MLYDTTTCGSVTEEVSKQFFSEEKNQKTFVPWRRHPGSLLSAAA
jgi:hypothetical protein